MTIFNTEIYSYTIRDGLPDNWIQEIGSASISVIPDTSIGAITGRVISRKSATSGTHWSWTTPGSISGDTEVLALVRLPGPVQSANTYSLCTIRQQPGLRSNYRLLFLASSSTGGNAIRIVEEINGVNTLRNQNVTKTWQCGTWYWARFRVQSTAFGAKFWEYGTDEPTTGGYYIFGSNGWTNYWSGTPAWSSGRVGFDLYDSSEVQVASFAASSGETVPFPAELPFFVFEGEGFLNVDAVPSGVTGRVDGRGGLTARASSFHNVGVWLRGDGKLRARGTLPSDLRPVQLLAGEGILAVNARSTEERQISAKFEGKGSLLSVDATIPLHPSKRFYAGDSYIRRYAPQYAEAFNKLLPTGFAWPREPFTVLQRTVAGLSAIWGTKVEDQAALLLTQESDPRTTVVLISDWERAWGLPDKCTTPPVSLRDRQIVLVTKMTMIGAQSREFFVETAAKIGYTITIHEFAPFMAGVSMAGDTRNLDDTGHYRWEIGRPEMRFYWTIRVGSTRLTWFRASSGQAGVNHHLEFTRAEDIECMLTRWKPAHTQIIFDYSPLTGIDASQPFNLIYFVVISML